MVSAQENLTTEHLVLYTYLLSIQVLCVEQKLMKRKLMEGPGLTWADTVPNGASIIDRDEQVKTGEALIVSTPLHSTSFKFSTVEILWNC